MQAILFLVGLLAAFFRPSATVNLSPTAPNIPPAGGIAALPDLIAMLNQIATNAAPGPGDFSLSSVTSGSTLTAAQMINGFVIQSTGGAVTNTCDTAANIVKQLPGGQLNPNGTQGRSFIMALLNANTGTVTLATATGITLKGTMTVASNHGKFFLGQVASSIAVTISDLFDLAITY